MYVRKSPTKIAFHLFFFPIYILDLEKKIKKKKKISDLPTLIFLAMPP